MRLTLLFCFLSVLFTACEGETANRRAARGVNFAAAPDQLYFKNTRAHHYRAVTVAEGTDRYLHDELFASSAVLLPVIVNRWIDDAADLHLELRARPGEPPTEGPFQLTFTNGRGKREVIQVNGPLPPRGLRPLRSALGRGGEMTVSAGDRQLPAFPDPDGRQAAGEVIDDYLRLVGG